MKATDLLRQQHREVEELFRQLQSTEDEEERASLREELAANLAAHAAIEEELFYPAAMEAIGTGGRIREAFEEHAVADFALYRFLHVSPSDETFAAKLGTLKDVVMNHVEEEESELLPQAEGEIDREKLEMLGERLSARFEERLVEGAQSILERSLGIAARQVAVAAPGAKKASPRRQPQKRATKPGARKASAKSGAKRGAGTKRGAASTQAEAPQKRATKPARSSSSRKSASTQKSSSARGQGVSRTQTTGAGGRAQTSARTNQTTAQKAAPRNQAPAQRKPRAGR